MRPVVFIFLLMAFGCVNKSIPKEVMQPNEMKVIVWDMIAADEISSDDMVADTTVKLFGASVKNYSKVLQIHKISKEEFNRNLRYYEEHPDKQKILYDSVIAYANRLKARPIKKSITDTGNLVKPERKLTSPKEKI